MKRLTTLFLFGFILISVSLSADQVTVSSLEELASYTNKNGNEVRMEPGRYHVTEYISLDQIDKRRANEQFHFMTFSGGNNIFDLRGVTIIFDTRLREKLDPPIHTPEFVLSGDHNLIKGCSIINKGNGSSDGGNVLAVNGNGNTVKDMNLLVRGSYPYGYGDLLGFGGKPHQQLHGEDGEKLIDVEKHSGVAISGNDNRFIDCRIKMRSLGHAFHIHGADNTLFRDCHVEGKMRPTDDMLEETSGTAYEHDFRAIPARGGKIKPGYVKSLSEDAFRIYSAGKVKLINCTAKNMRKGFAVSRGGPAYLKNCVSIGNGDGFRVSAANDVLKNCRGDAKYGPLLLVLGGGHATVDMKLMPGQSDLKGWRHDQGIALIGGETGSDVTISSWKGNERERPKTITLGHRKARDHRLVNKTTMPIEITDKAKNCTVRTKGEVLNNEGENIEVTRITD